MHHTHITRPPHMRSVLQNPSPQLHPAHSSGPPVGINIVPPHIGPPSSTAIQQQHHMQPLPTAAHHSGPPQQMTPYIPPHQRDTNRLNHHAQQRINSQMHQSNKNRSHVNTASGSGLPNTVQQQQQHQQQQQTQPQNIPAPTNVLHKQQQMLQQKSTLSKSGVHQQQQQSSSHSQSHNSHQQLSKHPPPAQGHGPVVSSQHQTLPSSRQKHHSQQQSSSSSSNHHQTSLSQHNVQTIQPKAILTQKCNIQQQQQQQQQQKSSHSIVQIQTNAQKQNTTTILQKSPHQQHQYKILKSQSQQNTSSNNCSGGGTTNCNVTQQQQSSTMQTSQSTTATIRINASSENISYNGDIQAELDITPPQQQQQKDKNRQITELINCSNNIQQQQIQNSSIKSNETALANTKEKTPMCLVNELARFNKIQHQYRLTGEQGPAHSKRFTVTLKLGDEEYTADGPSIKKAQHSAAAEAVLKTKYTHPPMKTSRLKCGGRNGIGNITPTVELNALAMKLGKPTVYIFDSSPPPSIPSPGTTASLQTSSLPPLQQQQQTIHHQQHSHSHCGSIIATGATIGTTSFIPTHINGTIKSSSNQQNHYSMHVPNHVYYQDGYHHYQSYTRNNSMNVHHPPVSQNSGLSSRRSHLTRGGHHRQSSHAKVSSYNNGMTSTVPKTTCRITLMVGKQKFIGIGETPQAARHDAAAKALRVLKPLSLSSDESSGELNSTTTTDTIITTLTSSTTNTDNSNADIKSPISLVHEIALQRNLSVTFEVKLEKGPPHMKTFITECKVGNIVTEGEGNGKKISKKRAAEKMLGELKKLPPLCPFKNSHNPTAQMRVRNLKPKTQLIKKKTRNIIKDNSKSDTMNDDINPISKLIQIQQSLKEREPIYTLVEEKGAPRRREFVIEVSAGGQVARGTGPNKKLAKKIAAKNLLTLLGYDNTSPNKENNSKMANEMESVNKNDNCNDRVNTINSTSVSTAVTTAATTSKSQININQGGSAGRQIVPGLLLMQQTLLNTDGINPPVQSKSSKIPNTPVSNIKTDISYGSTIETKNDNVNGPKVSDNINTIVTNNNNNNNTINCDVVRPKDQLLYLADLLGFQVVFSDYPKGNHGEFLTIVTLSTDPPQICHGAGSDTNVSQDKAATTALQMLSNLGLDNVKPKRATTKNASELDEKKKLLTTGASSNE